MERIRELVGACGCRCARLGTRMGKGKEGKHGEAKGWDWKQMDVIGNEQRHMEIGGSRRGIVTANPPATLEVLGCEV